MGVLNELPHFRSSGFNGIGVPSWRAVTKNIALVYGIKLHAIHLTIICPELTLTLVPSHHQRVARLYRSDWDLTRLGHEAACRHSYQEPTGRGRRFPLSDRTFAPRPLGAHCLCPTGADLARKIPIPDRLGIRVGSRARFHSEGLPETPLARAQYEDRMGMEGIGQNIWLSALSAANEMGPEGEKCGLQVGLCISVLLPRSGPREMNPAPKCSVILASDCAKVAIAYY